MTPDPSPPDREGDDNRVAPGVVDQPRDAPTGIMCGPRQPTAGDLEAVREFGEWLQDRKQQEPRTPR